MRRTINLLMLLPLAAAVVLAGPPAGGHSSSRSSGASVGTHSRSLSGPPPLGASGPAPVGASGTILPTYGGGGTYRGGSYYSGNGRRGRYPYGFVAGPYALPYYGYDNGYYNSADYGPASDYGPGPDYGAPAGDTQTLMMNQDVLGHQVQQLTAEIESMRSQQSQGGPQQLQPYVGAVPDKPADSDAQNEIPITLVLRSGQQLSVKNYAITDGMFWNFSKQPAQKIPVASIDVAASAKATEANGGDFPPISQ